MKNDLYDRTRSYAWNLAWFLLLILRFLIRHPGDKIEEEHLFAWNESARHSKTSMIINHEHTSFPRHLYDWVFFFLKIRSLTRDALKSSESKLKNFGHRLKKFPDENWSVIHHGEKEKKSWIERNSNIECRFSEGWHKKLVFQFWIEILES